MKQTRFLYFYNDREHFRRFLWWLTLVALLADLGLVMVPAAQAVAPFTCTGNIPNGNLFTYDTLTNQVYNSSGGVSTITAPTTATLNDDPYSTGACPNSLGVFGRIVCFFKSTIGQIVSEMYCSFQNTLQKPLGVVFTLFIVVVGITILTGMVQFTVREAIMAVLKVALVWAFATNASWGIGYGYAFFMALAEQGSTIVLTAAGTLNSGGGTALTTPDQVIGGLLNFTSTGAGAGGLNLPATLTTTCMLWLFTLLFLMLLYMPMVAIFITTMIIQYLWLYARALLGYLTALVLIGFLFVLAPLFLCFALFQITRPLFEQWLKYLTSFSLQMVVVFGFLAILSMVPIGDFFHEILSLLRPYDMTLGAAYSAIPVTMCSVCPYTINTAANATLSNGVVCQSAAVTNNAIPLVQLFSSQDLVQVIVSQIVALWIIGSVMQDFLKKAPEFARDLTGKLPFAAALGAGAGAMMNDGTAIEYAGLDSIQEYTENLPQKLLGGMGSRGMIARSAVGLGLLAKTGLLGGIVDKMGNAISKNSTQPGSTSAATGITPGVGTRNNQNAAFSTTAGAALKETSQRAMLGASRTVVTDYKDAADTYKTTNDKLIEDYDQVQHALQVVERYNASSIADPVAKASALKTLKEADDAYLVAWTNRNDSYRRMAQQRQELQTYRSTLPQDRAEQVRIQMSEIDQQDNTLAAQVTSASGLTDAEMRTQIDQNISHLQLQASVQQALLPPPPPANATPEELDKYNDAYQRMQYAQQGLSQAIDNLGTAKTSGNLEDIMKQLYVVEKALS